jgi:inner membrane protein
MDNLTHSLVGLMLARAGLEKTTPRGTAMIVLAANAPDADAFVWFTGTLRYIEYHRTYTHCLTFLPLVALLPMLLARAKFSLRSYVAAMIGVLSHLLMDWTNAYGIPLALPFSNHRFRLDINNIVDVWILLILLIPVAATALTRLVNTEIGERKSAAPRRTWAWASLVALVAFEGFRLVTHARAIEVMSARLYEGAPPRRATALPNAVNPFTWRGIVEGANFALIVPVNLLAEYDPSAGHLYRAPAQIPGMEAALHTRPFQVFTRWSQLPFWRVTPVNDGLRLDLIDLRFGAPDNPGFAGVSAVVDATGNVLRSGFGI